MVFILKRGVSGSKLPSCPSPASTASTATPEWTAASSALCHPFFNSASNGRTGEPSDSGGASPDVTRPVPTVGTTGRPHRWGSHGVLGLPITIYYTHIHTHTHVTYTPRICYMNPFRSPKKRPQGLVTVQIPLSSVGFRSGEIRSHRPTLNVWSMGRFW